MATCRDIVTRAMRMAKIVGRAEDPDAEEMDDGMVVLSSLYEGWLSSGMFGRLSDSYQDGSTVALEGQRIYVVSGTVTLPVTIDDDRQPRDLTAIEVSDDNGRRAYIWDRTTWAQITGLGVDDEAPLATRSANGLASCVAVAFAEEFGATLTASAVMQARNFKTALSFKFGSEREPSVSTYF